MARQTPRGARPNRRGGLARPVAPISQECGVCFARASAQSNQPSGRLLESRREPGPRGMIATANLSAVQNPAYRSIRQNAFVAQIFLPAPLAAIFPSQLTCPTLELKIARVSPDDWQNNFALSHR